MEEAAKKAGLIILDYFNKTYTRSFKYDSSNYESLVTEADYNSQHTIKEYLTEALIKIGISEKEIGFIGEESLNRAGLHKFIIDPLDGTTNFAFGIPYFCISIAYMFNNQTQSGLIYNPIEETVYFAEKGKGAYRKTKSQKDNLSIIFKEPKDSIIAAHYNSQALQQLFNFYEKIVPISAGLRTMGSIALDLCYFTENKFQIVVNGGCYVWDIAAAKLIIEESGGILVDWNGKSINFDFENPKKYYRIFASHPKNKTLLSYIDK